MGIFTSRRAMSGGFFRVRCEWLKDRLRGAAIVRGEELRKMYPHKCESMERQGLIERTASSEWSTEDLEAARGSVRPTVWAQFVANDRRFAEKEIAAGAGETEGGAKGRGRKGKGGDGVADAG